MSNGGSPSSAGNAPPLAEDGDGLYSTNIDTTSAPAHDHDQIYTHEHGHEHDTATKIETENPASSSSATASATAGETPTGSPPITTTSTTSAFDHPAIATGGPGPVTSPSHSQPYGMTIVSPSDYLRPRGSVSGASTSTSASGQHGQEGHQQQGGFSQGGFSHEAYEQQGYSGHRGQKGSTSENSGRKGSKSEGMLDANSGYKRASRDMARMSISDALDKEQIDGLRAIRAFLKVRTSYDVLPLSYRLIIFDTSLLVKKSLNILMQCGIVSAPLWDSKTSTFAGLLTTSDYLNLVQYYSQNPDALAQIDQFRLNSLRDIERAIGVTPIETVSIHPLRPLYEACRRMLESRARRIPLVDVDDETQREMVVSVVTQYRILKFVSVNVKETQMLRKPLRELNIGTLTDLATAYMDTPVMDVIHSLVKRSISCVPILDRDGTVLNVFEAVDVIALIKGGDYDNLQLTVGKALEKRSDDFPGIYTCTLNDRMDTLFDTIRKSRIHRLVIVDDRGGLKGILSLSDILDYALNSPLGDDEDE